MIRFIFILVLGASSTIHCIASDDPIILATNNVLSGTADSNLLGQSFTVSEPVTISSVELYVQRQFGGSSFQVFLKPFDPWTNTAGAALTTVTVFLEAIPTSMEGGWITVDFEAPVMIDTPGIYGVFVDTDSNDFPDGYNAYGYAEGDSILGGRLTGPIFNRDVEMMIRIRGAATAGALLPPDLAVPRFKPITSELRYTAFGTFTFVRFTWDTQTGVVYRILRSDDLITWLDNKVLRLGNGAETYYETSNQYKDTSFIKVIVVHLGDYKK